MARLSLGWQLNKGSRCGGRISLYSFNIYIQQQGSKRIASRAGILVIFKENICGKRRLPQIGRMYNN